MVLAFGEAGNIRTPKLLWTIRKRKRARESDKRSEAGILINVSPSPLIYAKINKVSTNVIPCSNASLTGGAVLDCPFESFHELQRSLLSNLCKALKYDVSVADVAWNLVSNWMWKSRKHLNFLESQAIILGIRWLLRQRVRRGRHITVLTHSQVLYYMLLRGLSWASRLWRLRRCTGSLCLARNLRIDPILVST